MEMRAWRREMAKNSILMSASWARPTTTSPDGGKRQAETVSPSQTRRRCLSPRGGGFGQRPVGGSGGATEDGRGSPPVAIAAAIHPRYSSSLGAQVTFSQETSKDQADVVHRVGTRLSGRLTTPRSARCAIAGTTDPPVIVPPSA